MKKSRVVDIGCYTGSKTKRELECSGHPWRPDALNWWASGKSLSGRIQSIVSGKISIDGVRDMTTWFWEDYMFFWDVMDSKSSMESYIEEYFIVGYM